MTERRTSVAKDALKRRTDSALERYGLTTESFNQARQDDPEQSQQNANPRERREGSEMVETDQAKSTNRPPEEIARPVDRDNFDERWTKEQNRAGDLERGDDYER